MSIKPTDIVKWALDNIAESRQGLSNKIKPNTTFENNGSLDGNLAQQHYNFMMNVLGLWSVFLNDMTVISNGSGTGLTKDDHFSLILAFDKTNLNNFVFGFADKVGAAAASIKTLNNNVLTFDAPQINGNVAINGASTTNVKCFSLNFKL